MKNAKSLVVPLVLLGGVFLLIKYASKKKSARMNDQSTNGGAIGGGIGIPVMGVGKGEPTNINVTTNTTKPQPTEEAPISVSKEPPSVGTSTGSTTSGSGSVAPPPSELAKEPLAFVNRFTGNFIDFDGEDDGDIIEDIEYFGASGGRNGTCTCSNPSSCGNCCTVGETYNPASQSCADGWSWSSSGMATSSGGLSGGGGRRRLARR